MLDTFELKWHNQLLNSVNEQSRDFLNSFFEPRSLAIVGISRRKPSLGQLILDNLEMTNYSGKIFLLNPKSDEIRGYKCYKTLEELPEIPEFVIILIPPKIVPAIVQSCIDIGVKAVTIITAGFSEVSEEGAILERQIGVMAADQDIRIVGPNSMGTFSHSTHASFSPIPIDRGDIGFLSQSGSIVVVLLEHLRVHKLGFSKFISLGNQVDINMNYALKFLEDDPDTKVITAYAESIINTKEFRKLTTRISLNKPLIMVKSGRSEAGARAASSHTGALAGEDRLIHALLTSCGIIRVSNIQELAIVARGFSKYRQLSGPGIALVSSAGGPGIIATDEIYEHGLHLAKLSDNTKNELKKIVPPAGSVNNPVDIIADADIARHVNTTKILLQDPQVAAVIVIVVHPVLINANELLTALNDIPKTPKPILICYTGPQYTNYSPASQLLVTETTRQAVVILQKLWNYTQWKNSYSNYQQILEEYNNLSIHKLDLNEFVDKLESIGFSVPISKICSNYEEIIEFTDTLSSPVVMKISHPQFSHKSDVGGVYLNLSTHEELEGAYRRIDEIFGKHNIPVDNRHYEIQRYYTDGIELVVGIYHDQQLGEFLMVGMGGTLVEIMQDIVFHPLPVDPEIVKDLLGKLKMKKLLTGFRNYQPVNLDKLSNMIASFATLSSETGVLEMDINPLLIYPETNEYVILDLRVEFKQDKNSQ